MAETRVLKHFDKQSNTHKKFSPLTHVDSVFFDDGTFLSDRLSDIDAKFLEGYTFVGKAEIDTNPGIPKSKVYYVATEIGTYVHFGIVIAKEGTWALKYDGKKWVSQELKITLTTDKVHDLPTDSNLGEVLITSDDVDNIQNMDESLLSDALRKSEQKLNDLEKQQVHKNIGIDEEFAIQNKKIDDFKTTITNQVENFPNITINGNVNNAPDEEDITQVTNDSGSSVLRFADRGTVNGMGYTVLRKDKTFKEQVEGKPNTIFEIRYNFDLGGNDTIHQVNIPEGCILKFEGGSLSNGKIIGNYTVIEGLEKLNDIIKEGNFNYMYQKTLVSGENIKTINGEDIIGNGNIEIKSGGGESDRPNTDGMGYVVIKKDIPFSQQIQSNDNTIFEIQYDMDLGGEVTLPNNSVLKFNGGSLYGGTLNLNYTYLDGNIRLYCKCLGNYKNETLNPRWFGAIGDGSSHPLSEKYSTLELAQKDYPFVDSLEIELDTCGLQTAMNLMTNTADGVLIITAGEYLINRTLVCKAGRPIIRGCGSGGDFVFKKHGTILHWVGANGTEEQPNYIMELYTLKNDDTFDTDVTYKSRQRPIVESISFIGQRTKDEIINNSYYVSGLYIGVSNLFHLQDLHFFELYDGMVFSTVLLSDIISCFWYNIYRDCLSVRRNKKEGGTSLKIIRCEFAVFRRYAINIQSQVPSDHFTISQCSIEGTDANKVRPSDEFIQGIRAAVCFIGSSCSIIENTGFEQLNGHKYNIHLCNCSDFKIINNVFDKQGNSKAIAFSATSYTYTKAYIEYYNKHLIADFSKDRNVDLSNTIETNSMHYIAHNSTVNGTFEINVLGKRAYENISYKGYLMALGTDLKDCIKAYEVINGKIDYSKEIEPHSKPYIYGRDLVYNGFASYHYNNKKPIINLSNLFKFKIQRINDEEVVNDSLCFNQSVLGRPLNNKYGTSVFFKDSEGIRYEAGVLTSKQIRYDYNTAPVEEPYNSKWKNGDIAYRKDPDSPYIRSANHIGWVCISLKDSLYKWKKFGKIYADALTEGTYAEAVEQQTKDLEDGFEYWCTDKQTAEGKQNGIKIYWNKTLKKWVDALGRDVV